MLHREITDGHAILSQCPGCNEDLGGVAMMNLVYTFTACDCDKAVYVHLVEQVWHRKCFANAEIRL